MKTLVHLVQQISSATAQHFGLSARQQSPFAPSELCSTFLAPLLEDFLSRDWRTAVPALQQREGLRVTDMMSGLIWSFIAREIVGNRSGQHLPSSPTPPKPKLHNTIADDVAGLIDALIISLKPYMARLEILSSLFAWQVDQLWHEPLHDTLEQLITQALRLKWAIAHTHGCTFTFVWPAYGEAFQPSVMQAVAHPSVKEAHLVAVPLSMGLYAEFSFCGEAVKHTIRPAEVRLCHHSSGK